MLPTWTPTVFWLMNSRSPISRFVRPREIWASTSRSRPLRPNVSPFVGASGMPARASTMAGPSPASGAPLPAPDEGRALPAVGRAVPDTARDLDTDASRARTGTDRDATSCPRARPIRREIVGIGQPLVDLDGQRDEGPRGEVTQLAEER